MLVHGYPPAVGGVELFARDLCERLVAGQRADVTVFTTNAFTVTNFVNGSLATLPIDPDEVQNGVKVRRFPVATRWAPVLKQLQRGAYHLRVPGEDRLRTWYNGPISPAMLRAVKNVDVDVVCAASFPLNHLTYPFRIPEPQPPIVLVASAHTTDDWGYRRPHLIRLIGRSYATVAHTDHERDWLISHGAPPDRLRVIAHGVDLERLQARPGALRRRHGIPGDAFVIAYVGQQAAHKGIDTLLRMFPGFLEHHPDAQLVVAGSRTPYSTELRRLSGNLPAAAKTRLVVLDDVSAREKAEIFADCDVFVSPSEQESFGITTLEAWAHAKPVVVGDGPAQRLVVEEGVSGLLVPYGNERALLRALMAIAADPDLRRRLGAAGRERLHRHYSLPQVVDDYFALFSEAAERGSNASHSPT
jgi:glycosyltransferase involved in cell wall biosynthesis